MIKVQRRKADGSRRDVLMPVLFALPVTLLIILAVPSLQRIYDTYFREGPWVVTEVSISEVMGDNGNPMILYNAVGITCTKGSYSAWIENDKGSRLEDGHEDGFTYCPHNRQPKLWKLSSWLGNDKVIVPKDQPFRVCVSYSTVTVVTGVSRQSGPYCSDLRYPLEK